MQPTTHLTTNSPRPLAPTKTDFESGAPIAEMLLLGFTVSHSRAQKIISCFTRTCVLCICIHRCVCVCVFTSSLPFTVFLNMAHEWKTNYS